MDRWLEINYDNQKQVFPPEVERAGFSDSNPFPDVGWVEVRFSPKNPFVYHIIRFYVLRHLSSLLDL